MQGVNFAPESDRVPDIPLQEDSTWPSRIPPIRLPATTTIRTRYVVGARPNVLRYPHEHLLGVNEFHGKDTWRIFDETYCSQNRLVAEASTCALGMHICRCLHKGKQLVRHSSNTQVDQQVSEYTVRRVHSNAGTHGKFGHTAVVNACKLDTCTCTRCMPGICVRI